MTRVFLELLFSAAYFGMPIGFLLTLSCLPAIADRKARTDPVALGLSLVSLVFNSLVCCCWSVWDSRGVIFWVGLASLVGSAIALGLCLHAWFAPPDTRMDLEGEHSGISPDLKCVAQAHLDANSKPTGLSSVRRCRDRTGRPGS